MRVEDFLASGFFDRVPDIHPVGLERFVHGARDAADGIHHLRR